MKSVRILLVTSVCLCGLWRPETWAQETADPAGPPVVETPPGQEQLTPNTVLEVDNSAGWKVELVPTLSVLAGDGLRLSALAWGNPFGVDVAAVDDALRSQLNIAEGTGVVITTVADESEAAKAGLKPHDIVLQINDQPVASPEGFNETVAKEQGHELRLSLMRQGQPLNINVTLPRKTQYELAYTSQLLANSVMSVSLQQYRIGVTLAEADDTLRSQLRLAAGEGLIVTEVVNDGPAAGAGIRPHDVLIKLDGKRLSTVENINAQIQEIGERQVSLDYVRAGGERTCDVTPKFSQDAALTGIRLWNLGDGRSTSSQLLSSIGHQRQADLAIRWLAAGNAFDQHAAAPAAKTDAVGQIDELKQKLAEITKSLDALAATLQPPAQEPKPDDEPPPDESKPK